VGYVLTDHLIFRAAADGDRHAELRAGGRDILIHRVEPVTRFLPGTGSNVSEDDWRTGFEMIYERVEIGGSVNIHLGHRPVEEVLEVSPEPYFPCRGRAA
jgi:hypothetical protein